LNEVRFWHTSERATQRDERAGRSDETSLLNSD